MKNWCYTEGNINKPFFLMNNVAQFAALYDPYPLINENDFIAFRCIWCLSIAAVTLKLDQSDTHTGQNESQV